MIGMALGKKSYINWYCRENNINVETLDEEEKERLYREYLHNVGR